MVCERDRHCQQEFMFCALSHGYCRLFFNLKGELMPLFHVEDTDRPVWVISPNWGLAMEYYNKAIALENECDVGDIEPPRGVSYICDDNDILIGPADCFLDDMPDWERNIEKTFHVVWPVLAISQAVAGSDLDALEDSVLIRISKWTDQQMKGVESYVQAGDEDRSDTWADLDELQEYVLEYCKRIETLRANADTDSNE